MSSNYCSMFNQSVKLALQFQPEAPLFTTNTWSKFPVTGICSDMSFLCISFTINVIRVNMKKPLIDVSSCVLRGAKHSGITSKNSGRSYETVCLHFLSLWIWMSFFSCWCPYKPFFFFHIREINHMVRSHICFLPLCIPLLLLWIQTIKGQCIFQAWVAGI